MDGDQVPRLRITFSPALVSIHPCTAVVTITMSSFRAREQNLLRKMNWTYQSQVSHCSTQQPNHPRVRSQECSLGYAPGGNMPGWRPKLIQVMSLAMPLGTFLGICAIYNHQCSLVPLGMYRSGVYSW